MTATLIAAPTLQVVSIEDARRAARVDGTNFDGDLRLWTDTAAAMAEQQARCYFRAQTWRWELHDWPHCEDRLPIHAATAVAVSYLDPSSAWQQLPADALRFWPAIGGTAIAPVTGTWPALADALHSGPRVRVDITAGATELAQVPPGVQHYVLAHIGLWIDRPEAASDRALMQAPWLARLLDPYTRP